jgi:signal transduction histidine kinase/CheY-like chemotaxis protein
MPRRARSRAAKLGAHSLLAPAVWGEDRLDGGHLLERRAAYYSLLVFAAALAAGAILAAHLIRVDVAERRNSAAELARASSFAIEQVFARSLSSASTLAGMVSVGASDAQLDGVARGMLELDGQTTVLQLARDFVITHLWPLEGNEAARGLDLARTALHRDFTRRVAETRRPLLYGPFPLVQGGAGLALRVPVVVREGSGGRVWGLSSAIIRVTALVEQSRVSRLVEAGYDYQLARVHDGADLEVLAAAPRAPATLVDPVEVAIGLPGQIWRLSVAPRGGWRPSSPPLLLHVLVLLVATLAAVLAYRVLSLPETLRREVAARTAELEVAHREQRRAEEAQRQSQKLEAVGLLAGGVAHDFNNLLVAILGYADLLAAEAKPGTVVEEGARTISQAARRAAELTRQLLAFARMGRHRQERVDVHAVAQEVVALLGRTLEKSIRLEARLAAPEHCVRGDPNQLQQVILNLAVNARDAMCEGGVLGVETSVELVGTGAPDGLTPGEYVVVAVSDTGVGIPPELQARIFEPFFTTKADGRGTGLGLATVYGIVKGHRGSVRLRSEPGAGSRFAVYLPLDRAGAAADGEAPAPRQAPRGSGVVLVVDDEELVRATAGRVLQSLGFEPVLVNGGEAALAWLARSPRPAAVLLDLAMPGMDGGACFREMRARHPGLAVVISSGFARNGRAQELLDAGAAGFVQKPYRLEELASALHSAVAAPSRAELS